MARLTLTRLPMVIGFAVLVVVSLLTQPRREPGLQRA
jgi:hypothetical protein